MMQFVRGLGDLVVEIGLGQRVPTGRDKTGDGGTPPMAIGGLYRDK